MAGTIKANAVQLGDSVTAATNFVLQTNTDGTAKLSRGNLGATTQDILTVDAAGKVDFPVTNALDAPVKEVLNASGAAPVYGCRAWVNFDGTLNSFGGADAANTNRFIRASGNVSSVLRNGAGDYTINFTTAMPDGNVVCSVAGGAPTVANFTVGPLYRIVSSSPTTVRIAIMGASSTSVWGAVASDSGSVNVTVFR